jgi:hypothetical protein
MTVQEEMPPLEMRSIVNEPASWTVLPNSIEGLFDITEHSTEYPEEGTIRWAVSDKRSADYLQMRLQALETIRGWIFDPRSQEPDTADPADLVRKIGELLTWYDERDCPAVKR